MQIHSLSFFLRLIDETEPTCWEYVTDRPARPADRVFLWRVAKREAKKTIAAPRNSIATPHHLWHLKKLYFIPKENLYFNVIGWVFRMNVYCILFQLLGIFWLQLEMTGNLDIIYLQPTFEPPLSCTKVFDCCQYIYPSWRWTALPDGKLV